MKTKILALIGAVLLLGSISFINIPQAFAEEEEVCDWFCETWNKIKSTADDVDDIWYWARDAATGMAKVAKPMSPAEKLALGKAFIEEFNNNPPNCDQVFQDTTGIDLGVDLTNPSTDDFFTLKLLAGIPLNYAKDAFPDDTFSTPARVGVLVPYYTYVWCVAHVERNMINTDTAVRDGYHEQILSNVESSSNMLSNKLDNLDSKLTTMNNNLTNIDGRLSAIENRLSNIEKQLATPSGKRTGWNN